MALTQDEARWLVAQGAPADRVRIIPVGPLSDPAASPRRARELLGDQRIVLFVGQLHDYKGFRQLLEAARRLVARRDLLFVFAGPDVRGHARAFATAGPNVRYLASVDDALRDSLLQACDLLCVPSSRESFGGALLDAWACGKPVIGGPAPATRELIEDGVDGWAVEQDAAMIGERLTVLLDDDGLRQAMGERGRQKVEARFSWPVIARRYLDLYAELGVRPA